MIPDFCSFPGGNFPEEFAMTANIHTLTREMREVPMTDMRATAGNSARLDARTKAFGVIPSLIPNQMIWGILACCFIFLSSQLAHATGACTIVPATQAPDNNTVLMLASTLTDSAGNAGGDLCTSVEAVQANALGFNVEIDDAAAWGAKSTANFATYRAIVLGDPDCVSGNAPIATAESTSGTWGPAITGPVAVVGTDPEYHSMAIHNSPPQSTTATQLTENAIAYATSTSGQPGAYISLSCYYFTSSANTPVPVLAPFGSFTVQGQAAVDDTATIVAPTNALVTTPNALNDTGLSHWGESMHEAFNSFPSNFTEVVHSNDRNLPYILAGSMTQTQTLQPGVTAVYPVGQDNSKWTPPNTSAGGEQLTVTAVPIAQSTFIPPAPFSAERCVPYKDFTAANNGTLTCVGFQTSCVGSDCSTLPVTVMTNYDLPTNLNGIGAIGGPDFLVFHNQNCPPSPTATAQSVFLEYGVNRFDPYTKGGSTPVSCYIATYKPGAPLIVANGPQLVFAGFQSPVSDTDLNIIKAGSVVPLAWHLSDGNGSPITTLSYCGTINMDGTCGTSGVSAPWVNLSIFSIACVLDATPVTPDVVAAGTSGLQNLGSGNYQFNWKTVKGSVGCVNVTATFNGLVVTPAQLGFKYK
jgi:hypothetical protein